MLPGNHRCFALLSHAVILTLCLFLSTPDRATAVQPEGLQAALDQTVAELRKEKKLVGLAAAVMIDGKMAATSASGVRKKGADAKLTAADRFHLGSITKSFTATVAGRLVERKKLAWDTTVVECFGDKMDIHADWKEATLEHLLTHTSGAQPNFGIGVMLKRPEAGQPRMAARWNAVEGVLSKPPRTEPGKRHKYSNVGYTIAGVMLEHTTGKVWEELIDSEVFNSLKIKKAGFGPPKDNGQPLSQPQGHRTLATIKVAVGQDADNTPIMGPAGTIHMPLADLCVYGHDHLVGERGEGQLLKAETYQQLHQPRLSNYACGWVAPRENPWTKGRIIWHNGSNTMWFAMLAILPDLRTVVAVAANDGDIANGQSASFDIIRKVGEEIDRQ